MRALAQLIACDIHPLNNVGPLRYLKNELGQDQAKIDAWYHHWVADGFDALEAMIEPGPYAFGNDVTLADICLVPQVYNARRLKVPLDRYPKIVAVDAACAKLAAFERRGRRTSRTRSDRHAPRPAPSPAASERASPGNEPTCRPASRRRRPLDDRRAAVVLRDGGLDPRARGNA